MVPETELPLMLRLLKLVLLLIVKLLSPLLNDKLLVVLVANILLIMLTLRKAPLALAKLTNAKLQFCKVDVGARLITPCTVVVEPMIALLLLQSTVNCLVAAKVRGKVSVLELYVALTLIVAPTVRVVLAKASVRVVKSHPEAHTV